MRTKSLKICNLYVKFVTKVKKRELLGVDWGKKKGVTGCKIGVKKGVYWQALGIYQHMGMHHPVGTQTILISLIYGMHCNENFTTKLWKKFSFKLKRKLISVLTLSTNLTNLLIIWKKKCWKGAPFWKSNLILARTLEWTWAPCGCPLSPGARGFAHPEPIGVTPLSHTLHISYMCVCTYLGYFDNLAVN